jgi:protein-tyrosine phosphatase
MPEVMSGHSGQGGEPRAEAPRAEAPRAETPLAETVCRIVFVCTGNTCRSPLAQALCVKLLADRLGCSAADLIGQGYVVESGGLATWPGLAASPEAVTVGRALGVDLSTHESRPLTTAALAGAHYLVVMTHAHLDVLASYDIPGAPQPRLLGHEGSDISDPVGAGAEVYQECADQIMRGLTQLLPELLRAKEARP